MRKLNIIIPVVIIAIIAALSSIYIVDEREKALVLRFGQIKQVREEAGIGFHFWTRLCVTTTVSCRWKRR